MIRRLITDLDMRLVEASKSILLEIMTILGAYRESLVLVGGWAPYFIIESFKSPDDNFIHVGSLDIDIAVNPEKISGVEYKSMLKLIEEHGYLHSLDKEGKAIPYAFEKNISIVGYKDKQPIEIDFLGPEYGGRGKQKRHQVIQSELFIRKARGIDVVFEHFFMYKLKGNLPEGAYNEVGIQVADLVAALTMKGIQSPAANGINGTVEVFPEYTDGLKDVEGFSHIILIYHFHLSRGSSLRVKPYMDNEAHGVFAMRGPSRPNPIGISVVRLVRIEKNVLHIQDVDIIDGTPLLDIKPYVPEFDIREVKKTGWLEKNVHKLSTSKDDGRFTK